MIGEAEAHGSDKEINSMNAEILDLEALLKFVRTGERAKYLFFWGHRPRKDGRIGKQCLSQWYSSSFEIDGIGYRTAEHYMMAEKARLFGNHEIRDRILSSSHPGAAKKLGREIANFRDTIWNQNRFDIVVQGNLAKFGQQGELKAFLLNTRNRILVEASPVDTIWGIGLSQDDPRAENPEQWRGSNLLGFALMKVRSLLQ